jgi:hypothetical protein
MLARVSPCFGNLIGFRQFAIDFFDQAKHRAISLDDA